MAGRPAGVAGTLIITLGRATAFQSRRASSSVPFVVVRQLGRDLQAHVAVARGRALVDTAASTSAASWMSFMASVS